LPGTIFIALLTRISTRPNVFAASSTQAATSCGLLTSSVLAIAFLPISPAVVSAVFGSMSATTTFAPS